MLFYLWDWRHYLLSRSLYPLVFIYHTAISIPVYWLLLSVSLLHCLLFTISLAFPFFWRQVSFLQPIFFLPHHIFFFPSNPNILPLIPLSPLSSNRFFQIENHILSKERADWWDDDFVMACSAYITSGNRWEMDRWERGENETEENWGKERTDDWQGKTNPLGCLLSLDCCWILWLFCCSTDCKRVWIRALVKSLWL